MELLWEIYVGFCVVAVSVSFLLLFSVLVIDFFFWSDHREHDEKQFEKFIEALEEDEEN